MSSVNIDSDFSDLDNETKSKLLEISSLDSVSISKKFPIEIQCNQIFNEQQNDCSPNEIRMKLIDLYMNVKLRKMDKVSDIDNTEYMNEFKRIN